MHFYWYPDEESIPANTNAHVTPPSTPSYYRHLTPSLVPNSAAAWATAGYMYLNIIFSVDGQIPNGPGNPQLLRWLLDWVRTKHEDRHNATTKMHSGELWFWRVVIGAYALTVVCSSSVAQTGNENVGDDEGRKEVAEIAVWYTEQLHKRRQATWAPEWDVAKDVLEKIQWLQTPGSRGELVLERIWRDSVRDGYDN